jgi:hypothetical protein
MHAGEEVFYLLIPLAAIYMIRDRRRKAKQPARASEETEAAPPWTRKRILGAVGLFLFFGALVIIEARTNQAPKGKVQAGQILDSLAGNLCAAEELVGTDPVAAADTFRQQVHGPLHDLADRASKADRSVAAKLLEAKYEVESATGKYPPTERLGPALRELNRQAAAAFLSVGLQSPACLT